MRTTLATIVTLVTLATLGSAPSACAPIPEPSPTPAPVAPPPTATLAPLAPAVHATVDAVPTSEPTVAPVTSSTPAASPASPASPPRPRLTSIGAPTWIYGRPRADERYIGAIRVGTSVALRSTDRVPGERCKGGFFAVEPRGFVCADARVTTTPPDRVVAWAAATTAATGPLPYRYAFSDAAPMYGRLPTASEEAHAEARFGPARSQTHPPKTASSYEDLASTDLFEPVEEAPAFLARGFFDEKSALHEKLPAGSMVSFTKVVADPANAGRTFLLSADDTLVPSDRVRLFHPSTFHGVKLEGDLKLPIAWVRRRPRGGPPGKPTARAKFRKGASGALEATSGTWPVKMPVSLTGVVEESGGRRFWETRERDASDALYIAEEDASIAQTREHLPFGVKPDQKWIIVHLGDATLVAYEGARPVFTTLVSPGRGGIPVAGRDNVEASTTPLGTFYVTFKDRAATMTHDKPGEPRTHWIADVPFTQYFDPPFALHAAYWHDRFGEDTSAGCINVSPEDAELLFGWSDPPLPDGWQGVTGSGAPENGRTTAIVIHR